MKQQTVNFCDLSLAEEIEERIWSKARALISRNGFILDQEVEMFENEFSAFCEASHCVGVATGCDALLWAMEGLGIGKGDEVITVANTFIGSVLPILRTGATPVLVDCDPATQQIDPIQVKAAITPRTSAILAVHLYGRLAPMDELREIADENGNVVSARNLPSKTTILDQRIINQVIQKTIKTAKYNKEPGAALAEAFITVKIMPQ